MRVGGDIRYCPGLGVAPTERQLLPASNDGPVLRSPGRAGVPGRSTVVFGALARWAV